MLCMHAPHVPDPTLPLEMNCDELLAGKNDLHYALTKFKFGKPAKPHASKKQTNIFLLSQVRSFNLFFTRQNETLFFSFSMNTMTSAFSSLSVLAIMTAAVVVIGSSLSTTMIAEAAAAVSSTAAGRSSFRGAGAAAGAAATATSGSTTMQQRNLEDSIPPAKSHKVILGATEQQRGMLTIENFEYMSQPLIDDSGRGLTPIGQKLLSTQEGMKEIVPFGTIVLDNVHGGGFILIGGYYDGSRPPVDPTVSEIQVDYDCEDYKDSMIDYLLCTADLISICNDASNCELLPGPTCSCNKDEDDP
jgi:hypothetical protein